MSPTPVSLPPGLADLLRALRTAGLAVGAREVIRLRTAFELAPRLAQDRGGDAQLRRLLTAALVHAPEEEEVFDEVYETWAESWTSWERTQHRVEEPVEPAERPPAPRGRAWRTALTYGRLSLIVLVAVVLGPRLPELAPPYVPPPLVVPGGDESFRILEPGPIPKTYEEWVPKIEILGVIEERELRLAFHFLPLPLILGGSLILLAAVLWERQRRRPPMPELLPPPPMPGPDRLPPLPLAAAGPELLDAEAARTLVWGVGRHFTEDFRPELDLDATARRTAEKAGLPVLCFERESRLREVWLWVDGTSENPALEAYAEEVASSLAESGLPARIGGFDGYPLELAWDEGQRFRPLELEAHRQTALVAVLTDGAVLLRHLEDERQEPARALLRALAAWPRLAFVDFADGKPELRAELERHGLACVEPEALPSFFGLGSARAPLARSAESGELELWSATLALAPRPVERSEAHLLRRELGLDVSPWALDAAAGTVAGTRLGFTPERRRELLVWLTDVGADEGVRPGGVLDRALAFWERRLDEEEEARQQPGREEHWRGHPAERGLELDRALLRLWRDPSGAAEALAALRGPATEARLSSELAGMAPHDGWREGLVRLPWRFRRQPDRTRYLLAELGLGGVGQGSLRRSGRFGATLGVLVGLAVGAVLAGFFGVEDVPAGAGRPKLEVVEPPIDSFYDTVDTVDGWRIVAGTPRYHQSSDVESGARVRVTWEREDRLCTERFSDVELRRCGPEALRPTTRDVGMGWPRRSFAVLLFPVDDREARELATVLLYGGSSDAVLLGRGGMRHLDKLTGGSGLEPSDDQLFVLRELGRDREIDPPFAGRWVVATAVSLRPVIDRLTNLDGGSTLQEVWSDAASPIQGDASVRLSYCPRQEAELVGTGQQFVRICPGNFTMGDGSSQWDDEKPAHEVILTEGFWMARHEVTKAEYKRREPRNESDMRPQTDVTWDGARSFCRSLEATNEWELDLPTEAQWEYAARAGTTTRWSFGDEEDRIGEFAWYSGNSVSRTHEVTTRKPNRWGLHDMHGNVWEWVLDCWDENAYRNRASAEVRDPLIDPDDCASGLRVLRGGSSWNGPEDLRSACRSRAWPGDRVENTGFRCVRRPRRQP